MYDRDNLQCMIDCLEENRYAYTNYSHRNGCCSINSDLLLKQLKLNEKEIGAKVIDEFAKRLKEEYKPCQETDKEIYTKVCNRIDKIAEEMRGAE